MLNWLHKLTAPKLDTRDLSVGQLRTFIYGSPSISGVSVSEEMAVGLTAVRRGVDLISSTIASLDVEVKKTTPGKGKITQGRHPVSLLLKSPNDEVNAFKFWRTFITHCVCSGNAYAEIERLTNGQPIGLHIIHWRNIQVLRDKNGLVVYRLIKEDRIVKSKDMLHLTALSWDGIVGISPIQGSRETLGISVAAERYAGSVYGNGAVPRGILKVKGNPTPETKGNIREAWNSMHRGVEHSNEIGILPADLEFVETNMTPEQAQMLLSRTFQIQEVARMLGVPENLLFSGNQSYNSNEESNAQFYQLGLEPFVKNLQAEIDFKLLNLDERMKGLFVRYDIESFLRGNFEAMTASWSRLGITGIATQNESRERLGLNPKPGGDVLYMPVNMAISTVTDETGKKTDTLAIGGTNPLDPNAAAVQDTALNGAQIASLVQILASVTANILPIDSASGLIAAAFPSLSPEDIAKILDPLRNFTPSPSTDPALPAPDAVKALPAPDKPLAASVRAVLLDQIGRALRRQIKSKPTPEAHTAYLIDALALPHRAYAESLGRDSSVEDFASAWLHHIEGRELDPSLAEELIALI